MEQTCNKNIKSTTEIILLFSFWIIDIKQWTTNLQKSRVSIVLFDKDDKNKNVQSFFNREEKQQNITDIIKVLIDLFSISIGDNISLEKFPSWIASLCIKTTNNHCSSFQVIIKQIAFNSGWQYVRKMTKELAVCCELFTSDIICIFIVYKCISVFDPKFL